MLRPSHFPVCRGKQNSIPSTEFRDLYPGHSNQVPRGGARTIKPQVSKPS